MAISNLVLTRQIFSEEKNGAHGHYREPVPLSYNYSIVQTEKLTRKLNKNSPMNGNRRKNKNIQPAPEKQHSYKKERVYIKKSTVNVCSCSTATLCECQPFSYNLYLYR